MSGSLCKHKGCEKNNFVAGYCAGHAAEHGKGEELQARYDKAKGRAAAKSAASVSPAAKPVTTAVAVEKVIAHVEKASKVQVKEVVEPVAPALVMTEMDMELDQLFKSKRASWLSDLAGATTIRSRAKMFLAMSDSLEGMAY